MNVGDVRMSSVPQNFSLDPSFEGHDSSSESSRSPSCSCVLVVCVRKVKRYKGKVSNERLNHESAENNDHNERENKEEQGARDEVKSRMAKISQAATRARSGFEPPPAPGIILGDSKADASGAQCSGSVERVNASRVTFEEKEDETSKVLVVVEGETARDDYGFKENKDDEVRPTGNGHARSSTPPITAPNPAYEALFMQQQQQQQASLLALQAASMEINAKLDKVLMAQQQVAMGVATPSSPMMNMNFGSPILPGGMMNNNMMMNNFIPMGGVGSSPQGGSNLPDSSGGQNLLHGLTSLINNYHATCKQLSDSSNQLSVLSKKVADLTDKNSSLMQEKSNLMEKQMARMENEAGDLEKLSKLQKALDSVTKERDAAIKYVEKSNIMEMQMAKMENDAGDSEKVIKLQRSLDSVTKERDAAIRFVQAG